MRRESWFQKLSTVLILCFVMSIGFSVSVFASGVTQTAVKATTIPIKWDKPSYSSETVTAYYVFAGNDYNSAKQIAKLPATTTSYNVPAAAGTTKYIMVKYDYKTTYGSKIYTSSVGSLYEGVTLPTKVTGVRQDKWWYYALASDVKWTQVPGAKGYEIQAFNSKGKMVKSDKAYSSTKPSYSLGKLANGKRISNNSIYTFRVRAYTELNGSKYYGPWSDPAYLFTSPTITSFKRSGSKLKIKWDKVDGATSYSIYISTKAKSGYKKVKTVSAKKSSVTIKKFNKKKISKKKKYYCYVVTNKKVKGVTYPSGSEYYWKVGSASRNWF